MPDGRDSPDWQDLSRSWPSPEQESTGLPESGFDRYVEALRAMGEMPGAVPEVERPRPSVFNPPAPADVSPTETARRRHRHLDERVQSALGVTDLEEAPLPDPPAPDPPAPGLPLPGPPVPGWLVVTAPPVPAQRGSTVRPPDRRRTILGLRPGPGLSGLSLGGSGIVASLVLVCLAAVAAFVVIGRWQRPEVVREGVVTATAAPSVAPTVPVAPSTSGSTGAAKPRLGVFRGTSNGQVYGFERWLDRDVDYVVDFTRRDTWEQVANPHQMIDYWAGTRYRLVVSTPLLAENGHSTMTAGARGKYDRYYRTLARHLVKGGQEDTVIRLGWEFNLGSSKWSTGNPATFITYWRRVVDAMRSVPGQHFRFDWNVNVGETSYDGAAYYPGAKYVDYVGVDVYDVSWDPQTYPYPATCDSACRLPRQKRVWQRLYGGQHGLAYWSDFARSKGKPMSLPEWGLWGRADGHGGLDDPYFIRQMYRFVTDPANDVAYQAYFEADLPKDRHSLRLSFPGAAETFRKLFGKN